jgi:hypothetical protein
MYRSEISLTCLPDSIEHPKQRVSMFDGGDLVSRFLESVGDVSPMTPDIEDRAPLMAKEGPNYVESLRAVAVVQIAEFRVQHWSVNATAIFLRVF